MEAQPEIQEALAKFQELQPTIAELTDQLKQLKKQSNKHVGKIKKFMKQNGQNKLELNGITFSFNTKEKVVLKMDRVESMFSPEDVQRYKEQNLEQSTSFKIDTE